MGALGRVGDAATFRALRRSGVRARAGALAVTWLADPPEQPPRLAFAIGRPVGNAVARNRLRRRLRAIFADLAPDLRPGTYFVAARPEAATLDHGELRRTVCNALRRLAERS